MHKVIYLIELYHTRLTLYMIVGMFLSSGRAI